MGPPPPSCGRRAGSAAAACALLLAAALAALQPPFAAGDGAAQPRYKILTLLVLGGSSHTFDLLAVAGRLATRHDVTVVTAASELQHTRDAIARLGSDAGPMAVTPVDDLMGIQELMTQLGGAPGKTVASVVRGFLTLPPRLAERCERLVTNETLMAAWRGYDMVLTFPFPPPATDSCACLVAHAIDAPLMHVRDMMLIEGPANVPQLGSRLTREQVRGTWTGYLSNVRHWVTQRVFQAVLAFWEVRSFAAARRRLGLPLGSEVSGLTCTPWVEVVSSNWLHEEPQPIAPPKVMVGAISPRPSRPIAGNPRITAFADEAQAVGHGLVLVSFGSNSQTFGSLLNWTDYENLALAFADLAPVRVLWQLSPKALPAGTSPQDLPLGPNTLVVPWAPINDVLGHAACRAFVTHGGQKSTYEAMFHGVPIVGVPFMLEQLTNAQRAAARGFGVVSDESLVLRKQGQRFSRQGMASLVQQVLSPSTYESAAAQVGEAMRLEYSQRRPVDRAADEVELAMVHGGYAVGHSLARAERHAAALAAAAAVEAAQRDDTEGWDEPMPRDEL